MSGYNHCTFIGNLVRDIEPKTTPSGTIVGNGTLAVNRVRGGKEDVDYIDFVAFNKTVEVLEQFAGKGVRTMITGELQIDKWEKDGQKRSKPVVYVNRVVLLGSKVSNTDAVEAVHPSRDPVDAEEIPF